MGVADENWTTGRKNPYPLELQDRPIFLWGGGIWSWFDIDTLLQAFRQLHERKHPACLYFLAGSNASGLMAQNTPVQKAISIAKDLGILGKNVFFHHGAVATEDVPAYLEHSMAAVLSNPASIESLGCWRTRLLQTLWAGKPLVTSGFDPLSSHMAGNGAARIVEAGDATAFAKALAEVADDGNLRASMSQASAKVGEHLRWSRLLDGLEEDISSDTSFSDPRRRPSLLDALRYLAGI
jgi:glycosyltransferase involved in cell wall biosynthesis